MSNVFINLFGFEREAQWREAFTLANPT